MGLARISHTHSSHAEGKQTGRVIPFSDLQIGVTALYFNYAVGTRNLRHFQMIPGMNVFQL